LRRGVAVLLAVAVFVALLLLLIGRGGHGIVMVSISYDVVDDPGLKDLVRELIRLRLSSKLGSTGEGVDWLRTDIAILWITVIIVNYGDEPLYYVTNAFCEVLYAASPRLRRFSPLVWRVNSPVALPLFCAEEGHVYPLPVACTADLRYEVVPPRACIANEYFFIVTKPFRGTVVATARVCTRPFSNECRAVKGRVDVSVG